MSTSDDSTLKSTSVPDQKAERLAAPTDVPKTPQYPLEPKKPDQPQCDPGQKDFRYYTFRDAAGVIVATMLVPNVTGSLGGVTSVTYTRGTEYWFDVSVSTPSRLLTITWEDYTWLDANRPSVGQLSFTMTQGPAWAPGASPPAPSATSFVGSDVVLWWNLRKAGAAWRGSLSWFNTTGRSDVFSGLMPREE